MLPAESYSAVLSFYETIAAFEAARSGKGCVSEHCHLHCSLSCLRFPPLLLTLYVLQCSYTSLHANHPAQ